MRTAGNPVGLLNPVRREIWAVDKNVALTMTRTLDDFLSDFSYAQPRFLLAVLGVFAGVGLVLVAVGVYSVIAYTVSRQTQEIGIRMALGASRGNVIGMVLRMGLWLVAIGLAVGLAASLVGEQGTSERTLGRQRARSAHLCGGLSGRAGGGSRGMLVPGAARHADRPDDRAALRVKRTR